MKSKHQVLEEQGIYKPLWQVGDCYRSKRPYEGEPEYMILEITGSEYISGKFEGSELQYKKMDGFAGVHFFCNNLTRPNLDFDTDLDDTELIDELE